jgi:hypothetical protein
MNWVFGVGMIMVFGVIGVYNVGVEKHSGGGGFSGGVRTALIAISLAGAMLMAAGVMISTYKDALDSNPYKKEYVYKQAPDGSMVKYDSLYVKKK